MNIRQKILWLLTAGVTETIGEIPGNRFISGSIPTPDKKPSALRTLDPTDIASEQAHLLAEKATDLAELYRLRASFNECPLKKTAAHTINGRGSLSPRVLCLTEAPDTADDRIGILFAGEAGILLDKMLAAIGLNLSQNTYVSSLVPWRPPGNRNPTESELAMCRPFWEKEIELLRPHIILLLGSGAASALIGIDSLPKARSAWHDYKGIPVCATISPTVLLKSQIHRRPAWEDLKKLKARLDN